VTLPLLGEIAHYPGGHHTYVYIVGARGYRLANPDVPPEAVVYLVGNGETEGDGGQDEKQTEPGDISLRLRKAAQQYQQQGEEDVEPPLHGQGIGFPIEAPKGREEVLGEGGEAPKREGVGVAFDDLQLHQSIVDQQDEEVVGQDAQSRTGIEGEGLGTADAVVVPFEVVDEGLADKKARDDKEDVDTMWHGHIGETVHGGVEEDALSVTLYDTEDGESPQKVQSEDAIAVDIDAPKTFHLSVCLLGGLLEQYVSNATFQATLAFAIHIIKV